MTTFNILKLKNLWVGIYTISIFIILMVPYAKLNRKYKYFYQNYVIFECTKHQPNSKTEKALSIKYI